MGKRVGDSQENKFDGTCHVCNKYGHKAADCWHAPQNKDSKTGGKGGSHVKEITVETTTTPSQARRMTAENEGQPDSSVFVFTLADRNKTKAALNTWSWRIGGRDDFDERSERFEESLILVDSGSDQHVCGYSFAPSSPTRETSSRVTMRDAQGNQIYHERQRDARARMFSQVDTATAMVALKLQM